MTMNMTSKLNNVLNIELTDLVEEQKRTIRKLNMKIQKLEETLKKERAQRSSAKAVSSDSNQNEHLFDLLKGQMDKARQADQFLTKIMGKVKELIKTLNLDRFFNDNPQSNSLIQLYGLNINKNSNTESKFFSPEKQQINEKERYQPMFKDMVVLQNGLKNLNENYRVLLAQNQQMVTYMQKVQKIQSLYRKQAQNRKDLERELDAERRMRLKLKGLLEKSECQKNVLLMKIDRVALNERQIIQRKREEWVQLSKSLTLKISDLEKQKKQMHKQSMREKQLWSKKYGELLHTVRSLQLTRRQFFNQALLTDIYVEQKYKYFDF